MYGSEVEQVKLGCVAAAGHGLRRSWAVRPARMAARVLNGEANAYEMDYLKPFPNSGIYATTSDALAAKWTSNFPRPSLEKGQDMTPWPNNQRGAGR